VEKLNIKLFTIALALAFLAGCGTTGTEDDDWENGDVRAEDQARGGQAYGAGDRDGIRDEDLTEEERAAREARRAAESGEALREETVVYFDFDSAEIKRESRAVLEAHAAYLAANRNASVVLQGHTDERGTKEYNMALGERRAESVKQFLVVNDVNRGQIETVSYGEERPAVDESNEEAYAQNRRVEINY